MTTHCYWPKCRSYWW